MKLFNLITLKTSLMVFLFLQSQSVLAGSAQIGTMAHTTPGGATAIPSLSGTMLIVLSLLLFLVAYRVSKQKGVRNNKLFVTLLGAFAISSSIGGIKTISDANAGAAVQATTLNTTGSVGIVSGINYFDNSFEVPVTILSIIIDDAGFSCNNSIVAASKPIDITAPICSDIAPDNIIPVGAQCQLSCLSIGMEASDERLKNSIKPLLKLDNDIQIYSFKYNNDEHETYVGAMAQDLLKDSRYKHLVKKMSNDFYAVNYQALGLKMITFKQWQDTPKAIFRDH